MKPKPGRTGLKLFPTKKVDRKHIEGFWKTWEKPGRTMKELLPKSPWKRTVLRLSPATLATVRRFKTAEKAKTYASNTRLIEKTIIDENPKKFVLQPVQFFSRKQGLLLERVYPGPDIYTFIEAHRKAPRYMEFLKRRLKRKGLDLEEKKALAKVKEAASEAYQELLRIEVAKMPIATNATSVLLLDYNPKTGKVLLAIVDHGQPPSIQEW